MSGELLPIYLLPGMNFQYPVYSRLLPLVGNCNVVDFLPPKKHESLCSYASRMAERLPRDAVIGGVSFGGIVALEVAKLIRPAGCVLIASVRSPEELPPWMRCMRIVGGDQCAMMLKMFGIACKVLPRFTRSTLMRRLQNLGRPEGDWDRWAIASVLNWHSDSSAASFPTIHIHGDADRTFPAKYVRPNVCIANGKHSLPVSHPHEVAAAINEFRRSLSMQEAN